MSREYTIEETREEFLDHIRSMINYWDNFDDKSSKDKLEGLAFSILSTLDGCSSDLPYFIVAPCPHEDDKEFLIFEGENYYPENHQIEHLISSNISGSLHELFYKK